MSDQKNKSDFNHFTELTNAESNLTDGIFVKLDSTEIGALFHSINNPLAIVIGHIDSLISQTTDAQTLQRLETVKRNAERISRYLKRLREISESDSEK